MVDPAYLQKVVEDLKETLKKYPTKMLLIHDAFLQYAPEPSEGNDKAKTPMPLKPIRGYVEPGPTWEEQELRILELGLLNMVCTTTKNRDTK